MHRITIAFGTDPQAGVGRLHRPQPAIGLIEQRGNPNAPRLAIMQQADQVAQRHAGIDDVLDDDDVAAFEAAATFHKSRHSALVGTGLEVWLNRNGIQRLPKALYNLDVPVIAAINGPAIGAGLDLTCMCDIRIASDKATFAESFVKVGIVPGDGGAWLLPRAVGASKAAEMAFTGEALMAQQALDCGLVSRVVAPDQLMPEALVLARKIAANPGAVLRMTKRLLREGERSMYIWSTVLIDGFGLTAAEYAELGVTGVVAGEKTSLQGPTPAPASLLLPWPACRQRKCLCNLS